MAYELKRAKRITESVSLDGEEIPVILDLDNMAAEFNRRYNAVIQAEKELSTASETGINAENIGAVHESYGNAVIALFELTFGEEGAGKIVSFYEGKYIEMLMEVLPFFLDVVVPQLKAAADDKRQKLANIHKSKQRSKFGRGFKR